MRKTMQVRFKLDVDRAHIRPSKVDTNTAPPCARVIYVGLVELKLSLTYLTGVTNLQDECFFYFL